MSDAREQKIKVSVGLSARQVNAIRAEASQLGISDADVVRRWLDEHMEHKARARAEPKVMVLDRTDGTVRGAR